MNHRIQELISQATIPVIETNDYNGMAYETYQFSQEKFAELIIGDSIKLLQERAREHGDVTVTVGTVEKVLKEHFGVKS
jgi:hypothetical protein